jgi:hypothetical protein
MTQLPDPAQLQRWAIEMVPFTEVENVRRDPGGYLVADGEIDADDHDDLDYIGERVENVDLFYQYRPSYIMVFDEGHVEWVREDDVDGGVDASHKDVWEDAMDVEVTGDFVCATEVDVEAYWVLERVTIERQSEAET